MPAVRRAHLLPVVLIAAAVLVADQLTKVWALRSLTEGERVPVLGDLLGLTLLFNPGAALSIGATGMTWLFTVAAVVVSVIILRVSSQLGSRAWAVALGLLLGGAVGNLVDRLFREPGFAQGHVVDFIAYGDLFVGNVADIAIVAAAGLIVLLSLRGIGLDGSRATDGETGTGTGTGTETETGTSTGGRSRAAAGSGPASTTGHAPGSTASGSASGATAVDP